MASASRRRTLSATYDLKASTRRAVPHRAMDIDAAVPLDRSPSTSASTPRTFPPSPLLISHNELTGLPVFSSPHPDPTLPPFVFSTLSFSYPALTSGPAAHPNRRRNSRSTRRKPPLSTSRPGHRITEDVGCFPAFLAFSRGARLTPLLF